MTAQAGIGGRSRLPIRIATALAGLLGSLLALVLLLFLASSPTAGERANENDPCDRVGPLLEEFTVVVAGASGTLAIVFAVVSLRRYVRSRERGSLVRFGIGLPAGLVLGASFAYMVLSLVQWDGGPCNGPRFDNALILLWPTTALAATGALAMSVSALRALREPSGRHARHLSLTSAFTGAFFLCALWMFTVLGSAD